MFFAFGVQTVRRDVKGSLPERAQCARCGLISDFRRRREQRYFTLFFLPVFPISRSEFILPCNRCGASYYTNHFGSGPGADVDTGPQKAVLVCHACSGKMRVSLKLERAIRVACPHCREQFTVSVDR